MQRAWRQRVRQQQAWVQRQLRLERQVWERRVRFREVPRGEVRRVPVLHQQVRQGVARRGFPMGHGGNKLKDFRLAARSGVLAGWKARLYMKRERFALKNGRFVPVDAAAPHFSY